MEFNIIKSEFYKTIKSKLMIILVVVLSLPIIWNAFQFTEKISVLAGVATEIPSGILGCDAVVNNSCYPVFTYLMPILINFIFTSEFSKKTIRNIVLEVSERKKFILGKIAFYFVLVFFINLILGIFSTLLCTLINGWGDQSIIQIIGKDFAVILKTSVFILASNYIIIPLSLIIPSETIITILCFLIGTGKIAVNVLFVMLNNKLLNGLVPYLLNECQQYMISYEIPTLQCIIAMVVRIAFLIIVSNQIMKKKEL